MAKRTKTAPKATAPNAAAATSPYIITVYGSAGAVPSSTIINEWTVMGIPAVYRGVTLLAQTLAGLPKTVARQNGSLFQPVKHALNRILQRRSNPVTTPFNFFENMEHHSLLWGNGYGLIIRDPKTFAATAIYNMSPETVMPFRVLSDDRRSKSQWYKVRGVDEAVPAADVIHLRGLGYDDMMGYPLVLLLADVFEWAKNIQRFGTRYFKKGTQLQGAIQLPATATPEQVIELRESLRRRHNGMDSDFGLALLTGGATLTNTTIDPQKSQLVEVKADAVVEIARILGVSPWFLYELGRATWGNADQQAQDFVKYSLRPHVEKAEEELTTKLLTEAEQDAGLVIRFDVENLLRGDPKAISAMAIAEKNAGLASTNESRARIGLPPSTDPNADKLMAAAPGQAPPTDKTKPEA